MALEELINEYRQELNNTDMGIWKYIVQHRAEVRRSSIHELARACNVSTTTIVRFAQKLGLEGFGEFKLLLKREQAKSFEYDAHTLEGLNRFYAQTVDKSAISILTGPVPSSMKPIGFLRILQAMCKITSSKN